MIVKIHSFIQNKLENNLYSFEGKGLLHEQILHFVENGIHNEIRIGEDKIEFIRKMVEKETLYFIFQEKKSTFLEYNGAVGSLQIPLYTERLVQKDKKIEIDYILSEKEKFSFKIIYE